MWIAVAFVWTRLVGLVSGCSNLLIPRGSTTDGSTIITYSTDNPARFGDVVHWPAGQHAGSELREIFDFDTGLRLGAIPEAAETYNVVSNTNEHQLSIGETTFGGLTMLDASGGGVDFGPGHVKPVCHHSYGCLDYGAMIYVTLQRAKTAKEAIAVIDGLMQTYGYASSGESFSIADTKEVWQMEIMSKGNFSKGAVWVAVRIPDGYVSAHANQARIQKFAWDDPDNVRYAEDVASFARKIGVYKGTDADFSFSDVYDPVTFEGARFCEARVFTFFKAVAAAEEDIDQYSDYIRGHNLNNRMPLYVKVGHKISVNESMWHMRNHYEGTVLDPRNDVGAGAWHSPYRLGEDMTWKYNGATYVNERQIGTQKAAMNIVANQRPNHKFGIVWWGPDDSSFSLHAPLYGATNRLPPSHDGGNCTGRAACRKAFGLPGNITKFSLQTMHWVTQLVANYAYSRFNQVAPVVQAKLAELEGHLFKAVEEMDAELDQASDPRKVHQMATDFSYTKAQQAHADWLEFHGELFVTFVDGYHTVVNKNNSLGGCDKETPHFDDAWKARIVADTGDHYKVPEQLLAQTKGTVSKIKILTRGEKDSERTSLLEDDRRTLYT
eukprot:TRINITY_DN103117_c0_g1_i1.p1 TRINITY_DN103117_c0_g1~~TRINITY_DN103117_c0_g1_i1.p1  ORF type:complete len:608 (-),score=54.10 TRINITY_DN103117_c0_g1_i1:41-1864(-)